MPVRKTLQKTQRATYAVGMLTTESPDVPIPMGSGFFAGPDVFLTAHHVVDEGIQPALLIQEPREGSPSSLRVTGRLAASKDADFALLQAVIEGTGEDKITHLSPSIRVLDEGEPVYAHGYPLSLQGAPIEFPLSALPKEIQKNMCCRHQ